MRKICQKEGCNNLAKPNGYKKDGTRKFYKRCSSCCKVRYKDSYKLPAHLAQKNQIKRKIREYGGYIKQDTCCLCGFKALHRCQLDVDHIDGNHNNNSIENMQTLCANCHRYKTWLCRDITKKPPRS